MDGCSSLFDVVGRREIVGALKTLSVPCLTSSFYFSKLYWTGSLCGGTILFLLFWIYLIFVMFVLDLFTPVYPLCNWVSLSLFLSMNFYYLSKKKEKRNRVGKRVKKQKSKKKKKKKKKENKKEKKILGIKKLYFYLMK